MCLREIKTDHKMMMIFVAVIIVIMILTVHRVPVKLRLFGLPYKNTTGTSCLFDVVVTMCPFYPRDAMLARVFATATCLSVRPSVCLSVVTRRYCA